MAGRSKQGLSKHETKGYRISIGKKPDGNARTFWLGQDRMVAEYGAEMYRRRWSDLTVKGGAAWTTEAEQDVKQNIDGFRQAMLVKLPQRWELEVQEAQAIRDSVSARQAIFKQTLDVDAPAVRTTPVMTVVPTLHAAIDLYVEAFRSKATSESHKERTRQLLDDLKHYRADMPLADIDRVWLQTITDFIKSRPLARKRGTPLAPLTVRNTLRAWRAFFDWLDANAESPRFGGWQAPRRWEELFEVRITKLMTKAERDASADGPKQLTPEQIVRLYRAAKNDVHRICILLGVFAALGQKEIATLRRDEFDLTNGTLTHRRSKTGQLGKFWLPVEAVKLIRSYFGSVKTNADNLAFFTSDGSPMVTESSDAIRQAWTDIVNRVNREKGPKVEKGSQGFYHLRKFVADYAMRQGGPVVRDAFLSHAAASVGDKHYSNTRDFDAVFKVGRELHAELTDKGMFKKTK